MSCRPQGDTCIPTNPLLNFFRETQGEQVERFLYLSKSIYLKIKSLPMLKYTWYLTLFTLLLSACEKDPPWNDPDPHWGTVTALKEGKFWKATGFAEHLTAIPNTLYMQLDSLSGGGNIVEKCAISKLPLKVGTYPIAKTAININDNKVGANFYFKNDDELLGYYETPDVDSSGFITLLSYDSVTQEIRGTFELTFIANHKPFGIGPDTLRLRNGSFHTKIIK